MHRIANKQTTMVKRRSLRNYWILIDGALDKRNSQIFPVRLHQSVEYLEKHPRPGRGIFLLERHKACADIFRAIYNDCFETALSHKLMNTILQNFDESSEALRKGCLFTILQYTLGSEIDLTVGKVQMFLENYKRSVSTYKMFHNGSNGSFESHVLQMLSEV